MVKQPLLVGKVFGEAGTSDRAGPLRPELPEGLEIYARTPDFTDQTIPTELTTEHALGEGVWGILRVLEGSLLYRAVTDPLPLSVSAGDSLIIEPELPHSLQASGFCRFFIEIHIGKDKIRAKIPTGTC